MEWDLKDGPNPKCPNVFYTINSKIDGRRELRQWYPGIENDIYKSEKDSTLGKAPLWLKIPVGKD